MTRRILCVDDEPNVLQAFERQFHKQFDLHTALGPQLALEKLSGSGPFAVVVSDLRMPGMDGVTFLTRVREKWPDTVRVMLTGQADMNAAIAAVNEGHIFQFLSKPCPAEMLARTLEAGLEQHRLITAERELLEQTLRGAIGVMSEILGLVNPAAFSRSERIRRYVVHIAEQLGLAGQWKFELAAMLSQIGCVGVPPDLLDRYYEAQPLDAAEREILETQGRTGQKLLARIPRLEAVAEMVANQNVARKDQTDGSDEIGLGAHLLRVSLDFDELVVRGTPPAAALEEMGRRGWYAPGFLTALEAVQVQQAQREVRLVRLTELKIGMTINSDVRSATGILLMGPGQEVTASALARLRTFSLTTGVVQPFSVLMPHLGGRA